MKRFTENYLATKLASLWLDYSTSAECIAKDLSRLAPFRLLVKLKCATRRAEFSPLMKWAGGKFCFAPSTLSCVRSRIPAPNARIASVPASLGTPTVTFAFLAFREKFRPAMETFSREFGDSHRLNYSTGVAN